MTILLISLLALSTLANGILAALFFRKGPPTKKELAYDAQALLQDLMSGPALLKVEYLDRSEVLLRSPRHFR